MNRWILKSERLPKQGQKILFCFKDQRGPGAWYVYPVTLSIGDFDYGHFRIDLRRVDQEAVLCWMPIPESPYTNPM